MAVKVKLVGDLTALRKSLAGQAQVVQPLLEHWDELTPRQQRRFLDIPAHHAARVLLRSLPGTACVRAATSPWRSPRSDASASHAGTGTFARPM